MLTKNATKRKGITKRILANECYNLQPAKKLTAKSGKAHERKMPKESLLANGFDPQQDPFLLAIIIITRKTIRTTTSRTTNPMAMQIALRIFHDRSLNRSILFDICLSLDMKASIWLDIRVVHRETSRWHSVKASFGIVKTRFSPFWTSDGVCMRIATALSVRSTRTRRGKGFSHPAV